MLKLLLKTISRVKLKFFGGGGDGTVGPFSATMPLLILT